MARKLITGTLIIVGGIAIAAAILSSGCEGPAPFLGTMCGHNLLMSFIAVTLGAWFVLGMAAALYNGMRRS